MPVYGYARVSTDGQTLDAQIAQLKAAGAEKVFREDCETGMWATRRPRAFAYLRTSSAHERGRGQGQLAAAARGVCQAGRLRHRSMTEAPGALTPRHAPRKFAVK